MGGAVSREKVVVAIHGIGQQRRSDTIRWVARRFGDQASPPLPMQSLGHFHFDNVGEVQITKLDLPDDYNVRSVRLVEIFWADIPREVVARNDTLEDTKAWGESVASRAYATYAKDRTQPETRLTARDFRFGANVVEDIAETVGVLDNLFAIFGKLGLFRFDLGAVLRDYIGDVQIVTEFKYYRRRILAVFHKAMNAIVRQRPPGGDFDIYIIAHSEGTVISFLALLEALSDQPVFDPDDPGREPISTRWVERVRGFMTIGSPIDKHIVLWPQLWEHFRRQPGARPLELPPIEWRNYYDYGDPIGFKLDTTRQFLKRTGLAKFFHFVGQGEGDETSSGLNHDYGFSRYYLPGKAHTDYWDDAEVFRHFFRDVVKVHRTSQPEPAETPKSSRLKGFVSGSIPYLLSAATHLAAVFFLSKGATEFLFGDKAKVSALAVLFLGVLLIGSSFAARIPRLAKPGFRWHALSAALLVLTALPTIFWLPQSVAEILSFGVVTPELAWSGPVSVGAVMMLGSWLWADPRASRRALLHLGTGCLAVLLGLLYGHRDVAEDNPFWPLALAAAAFLYLWWLGVLIFDLAFVWHRYIRESVAVDTLSRWYVGEDATPQTGRYVRGLWGLAPKPSEPDSKRGEELPPSPAANDTGAPSHDAA